jgi:hypothetical protein
LIGYHPLSFSATSRPFIVARGLDSDSMIDRRLQNGSSAAKPICRIGDVT